MPRRPQSGDSPSRQGQRDKKATPKRDKGGEEKTDRPASPSDPDEKVCVIRNFNLSC